jgi:2'-5' RNA ligase
MAKSTVGLWWPATFAGSSRVEDPHCTLIYLGKHEESAGEDLRERLRWWLSGESYLSLAPGYVDITGTATFGPSDAPVQVLTLDKNPTLEHIHDEVVRGLYEELGIVSASEFGWNPHVTVGEALGDNPLPKAVHLGELEVW